MKIVIIKSTELGTNCWLSCRFLEESRCDRVLFCKYPEKSECKAVRTERRYVKESTKEIIKTAKELEKKRLLSLSQDRKWWQR
jgi:hypothetical protein